MPLSLLYVLKEPGTTTKRISVAIVLPSAVGAGDFRIRIIEDGDVLKLSVDLPKILMDISFLDKKWLLRQENTFNSFYTKVLGFEATLRNLRENENQKVVHAASIGLPFSVQSHIVDKYNIG